MLNFRLKPSQSDMPSGEAGGNPTGAEAVSSPEENRSGTTRGWLRTQQKTSQRSVPGSGAAYRDCAFEWGCMRSPAFAVLGEATYG